jgi:heat-inducible transcriptional repressor
MPSVYKSAIKIVQMVALNLQQVMVVLLTNTGTNNIVLEIPDFEALDIHQNDFNRMSNFLTQKLCGTSIDNFNPRLTSEILREMPEYKNILNRVIKLIHENLHLHSEDRVYSAGLSNMLKQPEFMDIEQMRHILSVVEHDHLLSGIFREYLDAQGSTIKIGAENKQKEMKHASIVATSYEIEGKPAGSIGIIGPTRMQYSQTTVLLDSIAERIQASLLED